jgi:hypothetical protein
MLGRLLRISNLRSLSLCRHVLAWTPLGHLCRGMLACRSEHLDSRNKRSASSETAEPAVGSTSLCNGTPSKRLRLASRTSERVFNLFRREGFLNRRSSEFGRPNRSIDRFLNALVIVLRTVHARTDRPSESLGRPLAHKPKGILVAAFVQLESASLQIKS